MQDGYFKKEYLPGYTGHVPKKNDVFGMTAGEVNRTIISKDNYQQFFNGIAPKTSAKFHRNMSVGCSPDRDMIKYGNHSRHAKNWIGGP